MKKTNKVKMSPLGTPLGNPLRYFNSLKGKTKVEPKQTLRKAQNGIMFKGSDLAKEYAKGPIAGAEPEWSALERERIAAQGPRVTKDKRYGDNYNNPTYTSDGKGGKTSFIGSNMMNDPRFSKVQEKTNEFYTKEKKDGTLYNKGFRNRFDAAKKLVTGTINQADFTKKKGGTVKKYQKGGYTVTNADGSPMTTPEGYRPPSVPSYPDFKKLRKTDPGNVAFMQLTKNPEEFDPKDVKKYGPKKLSKKMIREMSKESESAPMQTTPYKKGGSTKALPKAQFGAFIKAFSKVVKPVSKIVKPASKVAKPISKRIATTSKKNIPKKIDFRNTKNSMERMMESKQIQNYFKKSTQKDQLLKLVNKNKN
jgi:hypothetical protein